jgi:hypothetical protein
MDKTECINTGLKSNLLRPTHSTDPSTSRGITGAARRNSTSDGSRSVCLDWPPQKRSISITTKHLICLLFVPFPTSITTITTTTINKGMLQPIAYTNHRLNSSIFNQSRSSNECKQVKKPDENTRGKAKDRKRVTFTKEGTLLTSHPRFSLSLSIELCHCV